MGINNKHRCENCVKYSEDRPVNYGECKGFEDEIWPKGLTEEKLQEIFEDDGAECPLFEDSGYFDALEKIEKEVFG